MPPRPLFPVTLGDDRFDSVEALAAHIEARTRHNRLEERSDYYAAEWYTRRWKGAKRKQAVQAAAMRVLEAADTADMAENLAVLLAKTRDPDFYRVAMGRLTDTEGVFAAGQPRQRLLEAVSSREAALDPELGPQVRAFLEAHREWERYLLLLDHQARKDATLASLYRPAVEQAVAAGCLAPALAALVATVLAKQAPEWLMPVAEALAPAPFEARETYRDSLLERAKRWLKTHDDALIAQLRLYYTLEPGPESPRLTCSALEAWSDGWHRGEPLDIAAAQQQGHSFIIDAMEANPLQDVMASPSGIPIVSERVLTALSAHGASLQAVPLFIQTEDGMQFGYCALLPLECFSDAVRVGATVFRRSDTWGVSAIVADRLRESVLPLRLVSLSVDEP